MKKKRESDYEKIRRLEKEGAFDVDVMEYRIDDLLPIDADYEFYCTRWQEKLARGFLMGVCFLFRRLLLNIALGLKVRGRSNLKSVKGKGCIAVSNHCHPLDCVVMNSIRGNTNIYHTGAAFNAKADWRITFFKALGFLPLNGTFSAQKNFNKLMEAELAKGKLVHFYPEHAMWIRYEKPRPFKKGAFRYAAKYKAPVVPVFMRWEMTPLRKFLHLKKRMVLEILPPIFPDESIPERKCADILCEQAFDSMKACYESNYGVPLTYDTEKKETRDE